MLVYDEVQSGMGITGKWWAWQNHNVAPDLMGFGKKSQVCGFVSTSRLDEVENHVFKESSRINSTWGGNLTDMVRLTIYLSIIQEENLNWSACSWRRWLAHLCVPVAWDDCIQSG